MAAPLGCAEAVRRLWEYLDGGLDEADRTGVEAHLALCLRCCGELEFSRELRRLLRTHGAGELPEPVRERLEHVIDHLDDFADPDADPRTADPRIADPRTNVPRTDGPDDETGHDEGVPT